MAAVTPGGAFILLILAGAELCFLGMGASSATQLGQVPGHSAQHSSHAKTRKPAWHNGPASTPPETEVVGRLPPAVPPRVGVLPLDAQGLRNGGAESGAVILAGPTRAATRASAPLLYPQVADQSGSRSVPSCVDGDEGARGELQCLHTHPDARQAFYDDLRRTVERVRIDDQDGGERNPAIPTQ